MMLQNCTALFISLWDFNPTFCSRRLLVHQSNRVKPSRVESSGVEWRRVEFDSAIRRQFQSTRLDLWIVSELTEELYAKKKFAFAAS
jgi:hypothetical protein